MFRTIGLILFFIYITFLRRLHLCLCKLKNMLATGALLGNFKESFGLTSTVYTTVPHMGGRQASSGDLQMCKNYAGLNFVYFIVLH